MTVASGVEFAALTEHSRIEREQVRLAYGTWVQYVDGRIFAILLTILMCGGAPQLGNTSPVVGLIWLVVDIAWSLAAVVAAHFYFRYEARATTVFWRRLLGVIWVTNAATWSAAVAVFWVPDNAANQAILCTVVLALMVSYFYTLAPCFPVFCATLFVIFAAPWIQVWAVGGILAPVFLAMLPCFALVLANYAHQMAGKYEAALKISFENEALAVELAKANQAKSSFLASVSHELRTPLNAILGYSEMIRQRLYGPIAPARYTGYIDDIHLSGTHLLKMINDLMDLAKIESGKREFTFVALNPATIAAEAIKLVEREAQDALVNVMLDIRQDVMIRADARAVKQMLHNLLSNAVKFSRPGGIAVVFCETTPDDRTLLGVKDTGIGMSMEALQETIEPFAYQPDAYTVEGRSTGLGLPIVKGLIEAHQGQLKIESSPGAGSKVWVEFPPERLLRRAEAA